MDNNKSLNHLAKSRNRSLKRVSNPVPRRCSLQPYDAIRYNTYTLLNDVHYRYLDTDQLKETVVDR